MRLCCERLRSTLAGGWDPASSLSVSIASYCCGPSFTWHFEGEEKAHPHQAQDGGARGGGLAGLKLHQKELRIGDIEAAV